MDILGIIFVALVFVVIAIGALRGRVSGYDDLFPDHVRDMHDDPNRDGIPDGRYKPRF